MHKFEVRSPQLELHRHKRSFQLRDVIILSNRTTKILYYLFSLSLSLLPQLSTNENFSQNEYLVLSPQQHNIEGQRVWRVEKLK
jgi:hypothetical protein